jgi:PAS domain S-box-containing protein
VRTKSVQRAPGGGGELLSLPADAGRQRKQLLSAAAILLALTAYKVAVDRHEALESIFASYGNLPYASLLTNGLFFWLLALLWVAYRQWRSAQVRETGLRRIVASISPDVLLVVDPDRTITSCNSAVAEMFGYEPDEIIGKKTEVIYFDRRPVGGRRDVHQSLDRFGFHIGLATGRRKDESTLPLELITGLLRGASGAVVLIRDITERKRVEEQYLRAKEDAENSQRATAEALAKLATNYAELKDLQTLREKLTHMIVHDLKSPLSTIGGYLDIVRQFARARLSTEENESLNESSKLVRRMREMILSLLDIGRLEENKMPVKRVRADLLTLAREALEILGQEGTFSQVVVEAPSGPMTVLCDPDVMRRVIVNLVDNALKYTPPAGTVHVRVEPRPEGARVAVIDEGIGIPPEYHKKIFERFAQVEARKYSTGLGLTFCDLAVKAHGGTIGVDSEVGKGTTLWFELPEAGKPAPPPAPARAAQTDRSDLQPVHHR